ncbi:MAG: contact-dependent growth inhibition system immunity protein [Geobacteraceae bacterium]|nr:contact-dependent growth inhibition system immunity protein [Geobacteraceae bacterium]
MNKFRDCFSALTGFFKEKKQIQTIKEPIWKNSAGISATNEFINIYTYSGYRLLRADPTCEEHFLPIDAANELLGSIVMEALSKSRFLSLEDARALDEHEKNRNEDWDKNVMERYAYKSKGALYKNMKYCSISSFDGLLTIYPTRHEKLQSWGVDKRDGIENVIIPVNSSMAEIGDAIRLAFSRCIE